MSKEKILVIDDEPKVVEATAKFLELEGYEVLKAYGGAEGLHLATQEHPDLTLLDAKMAGMDGYEVLIKIKERKIPTRVIMLTAYREKDKVVKLIRAGACDYLLKDEGPEHILQAIKRALEIEKTIDHLEIDPNKIIAKETIENSKPLKTCFVIMPIGSGEAYEEYLFRYENIIKPAVEGLRMGGKQAYQSIRADFVSQTGSITRSVLNSLFDSDVVIADLSDLNPNVFYELGVRHSLRNKTILIASKGTKPPFDISDLRVIYYENKIGGEKKAIPELQTVLKKFAENGDQVIDSPVFQAMPKLSLSNTHFKEGETTGSLLEIQNNDLKASLFFVEQFGDPEPWNLPKSVVDEIKNLYFIRDNSVASKNRKDFLITQLDNKEILNGPSKGYLRCSKMITSVLKFANVTDKSQEGISSDFAVLVREDYERNNEYSHSAYLIYYLLKTENGAKILALKSI